MRLVPQHEVLAKLAAVQSADTLGRQFAQDHAMKKLASMAGVFMAHAQTDEGMDKLAQSMVIAEQLTSEEYEMLKEAGLFSLLKGVGGGAARLGRRAVSGTRGAAQNMVGKVRANRTVSQAMQKAKAVPTPKSPTSGSGVLRRRAGKVTEVKPTAKSYVGGQGSVQTRATKVETAGRRSPSRAPVASAAPQQGPVQYPAPVTGQSAGRVPPANQPKPRGKDRRAASKQQQQAAQQSAAQSAAQPAADHPYRTPANQAAAPQQAAAQPASGGKGGVGWGKALPWMAAGGLGYGLYKGVPWAARQMEQASTTPMAYGGGWSPVPYGYGHSPYGDGSPNMGMGT